MLILVLIAVLINLLVIDFVVIKVAKNAKKNLNLIGNLDLTDLDEEFWS